MDNLQRNIWQNVKTHQYITWWMKASAEIGTWPGCVVSKNGATYIIGDKEWLVDFISTYGNISKFPRCSTQQTLKMRITSVHIK